uniref:HD domain-containing protein n=1 Tax=Zea mays TaxID=4577 RepID=A0A804N105_MAIZE
MGEYCPSPQGDSALAAPPLTLPSSSPATAVRPSYGSCDRSYVKQVFDNLHGSISVDPLALQFVDTEEFQRLRDLKQLGLTYLVYPGAVHTRFEHSLGVYSLAGKAINNLKTYQGVELGIDPVDMQTVKLAGLLHDIGHGPFSHLFEHEFLPRVDPGSSWSHEKMSVLLLDSIVDKHAIDIENDYLKMVKDMITASSDPASTTSAKEKHFLYDIVANGRNGIDVDKFDYIGRDCRACGLGCNFQYWRLMEGMRVMGDEICYPAKDYLSIHKLFSTRADLHRTVYTHAKVKAVELMLVDALVEANDYLGISLHAHDPEDFWKLDDTIIKTIETAPNNELKKAKEIIQRIRRRELYKYSVPKDKLEHFKNITAQDIVCSQDFGCDEKFPIIDDRVSHLLPAYNEDRIVRVYAKNPELVDVVSEAFENLQMRMYGEKTQVHETPKKKKIRSN